MASWRTLLLLMLTTAACLLGSSRVGALSLQQYFLRFAHNPADRLLQEPLEDYGYDRAKRCRRSPAAGTVALQAWLERNWAGESWGINRCEKLGPRNYSLHAEGRALDWHLDARVPADRPRVSA